MNICACNETLQVHELERDSSLLSRGPLLYSIIIIVIFYLPSDSCRRIHILL